jgi:hypothetical protein
VYSAAIECHTQKEEQDIAFFQTFTPKDFGLMNWEDLLH